MALVVKDRVQETSTTTGTGTFTLAGAVTGFQSFSVIGNANTTYYAIVMGSEWEVGIGTYTSSGTTLSRDTILESSNSGSAVNFSAGAKNVFVTYPAEKGIYLDASGNSIGLGTPASATLTNATGLPLSTGVTGTLPIANGGTGSTSTTYVNLTSNVTGTLPVANGGTGITSLGTGVATFLGTPSSSNLASAITDETGSGSLVFATSPTLVTPVLGTPSSGTLTSCTGLPLTTGVTGTLPVANGGTGVTTSTGSGNVVLSTSPTLVTPNLGTPSTLVLTNATGLPASSLPTGSVLQVKSTTKADTQTITGTAYTQISGLTVSITPSSSSNKILISVSIGFSGGTNFYPAFKFYRDSTAINLNSGSGTGEECSFGFQNPTSAERYFQVNHEFLDSPSSTSSITYSVYVSPMRTASQTININTANTVADNNQLKGTSTITVMEVKG